MKLNAVRIPCVNLIDAGDYYAERIGWPKIFGGNTFSIVEEQS